MTTRDTERPPIQEQIDQLSREVHVLSSEVGFAMRYIRACARAMGAKEEVRVIDAERDEWRETNGFATEEDTRPSGHLKAVE